MVNQIRASLGIPNDSNKKQDALVEIQKVMNISSQVQQLRAFQDMVDRHNAGSLFVTQRKKNKTGLPGSLKSGIEHLDSLSMDDVKAHCNSGRPARLNAHADT